MSARLILLNLLGFCSSLWRGSAPILAIACVALASASASASTAMNAQLEETDSEGSAAQGTSSETSKGTSVNTAAAESVAGQGTGEPPSEHATDSHATAPKESVATDPQAEKTPSDPEGELTEEASEALVPASAPEESSSAVKGIIWFSVVFVVLVSVIYLFL